MVPGVLDWLFSEKATRHPEPFRSDFFLYKIGHIAAAERHRTRTPQRQHVKQVKQERAAQHRREGFRDIVHHTTQARPKPADKNRDVNVVKRQHGNTESTRIGWLRVE